MNRQPCSRVEVARKDNTVLLAINCDDLSAAARLYGEIASELRATGSVSIDLSLAIVVEDVADE